MHTHPHTHVHTHELAHTCAHIAHIHTHPHTHVNTCTHTHTSLIFCLYLSISVPHLLPLFVYLCLFHQLRAVVRTINPRESHVLETDQKLKRKLLLQNIRRCSEVVRTIMAWWQFIQSLWSWQNKLQSGFAFIVSNKYTHNMV